MPWISIVDFDPNWAFPDSNSSLNSMRGFEMMHIAWCNVEEVSYNFSRSSIKFQARAAAIRV